MSLGSQNGGDDAGPDGCLWIVFLTLLAWIVIGVVVGGYYHAG